MINFKRLLTWSTVIILTRRDQLDNLFDLAHIAITTVNHLNDRGVGLDAQINTNVVYKYNSKHNEWAVL